MVGYPEVVVHNIFTLLTAQMLMMNHINMNLVIIVCIERLGTAVTRIQFLIRMNSLHIVIQDLH